MTPTLAQALQLLNLYNVHALRAELEANQPGQPRAQAYDTDRTTSGQGPSDPTFTAATTPSAAKADLAEYQRHVDRLYAACLGLAHLADRHVPTHAAPRIRAKQETRGCELHRRAGVDKHRAMVHRTDFADVIDTALTEPIDVCRWCYDFPRRVHPVTGQTLARTPTNEEILTYERTGKLRLTTTRRKAA